MGMDISGGYGAGAAAQTIRDLLAQRFQARAYQDQLAQRAFENSIQERQLAQNEALKNAQLQSLADNRAALNDARQERIAGNVNEATPQGAFLQTGDPAIGMLKTGGFGSRMTPQEPTQPMGPDFVGPMPNGETPQQAQVGRPGGMLITQPTAKQAEQEAAVAERAQAAALASADRNRGLDIKENTPPKEPTPHFSVVQSYGPDGQPNGLQRINTLTGEVSPAVGGSNIKPNPTAPGGAQRAAAEASKKEALGSLDQLDKAIDAAKDLIGPGAGRISNIEQLVGNPDPRISSLGTKLLLTKMQVDHAATGTVRAGASPAILQKWDNLLSQHLNPANLKASVQAMREILGGGASSGGTIRARDPQGNLHEAAAGTALPAGWTLEK